MFTPQSPPGIGGRSGKTPRTAIHCECGTVIHTLNEGETIQGRTKEHHLETVNLTCPNEACKKRMRLPIFRAEGT